MAADRISKVLASAGVASRRGADGLVAAGRVTVDGRPATLGERVDPETQRVEVDGRALPAAPTIRVYLALHKPAGVVSTVKDRHAERTVVDLVPRELSAGVRLYPVGRLDRDSEGLILLTNDGDWAEHVLHPRYDVEREYAVALARPLTRGQAEALERGVELTEGIATVSLLRGQTHTEDRRLADILEPAPEPRLTWVRVTIHQGWKRQL
ncbi:MAG: pseudouridine synthase, partial [Chloroflexi bacterium]|nr:pseudouridine synthase [Chloroflexota bacterium]